MLKTRATSKRKGPAEDAPSPADLVANMLAGDGGGAERAALVSDILAELEAEEATQAQPPRGRTPRRTGAWSRVSFNLPDELMHDARTTTRQLSGPPYSLNLSRLTENALRRELRRLKRAHRSGREFPDRP